LGIRHGVTARQHKPSADFGGYDLSATEGGLPLQKEFAPAQIKKISQINRATARVASTKRINPQHYRFFITFFILDNLLSGA
jgi:hypothetical protein